MANQPITNEIRDFIIETVNTQKPETTSALVKLVQQKYPLSEEEILTILSQLETENKIKFTKKEPATPTTLRVYAFSIKSIWYWATITIAIATAIAVFTIPDDAYPIVYIRYFLGIIFVLFLPGFTLIKTLYPSKVPLKTSSENLDVIERIALSIGMSIALTSIVGLVLNYTPWGIRLTPITLSLLTLTFLFATVAVLREYQTKANENSREKILV